MDFSPKVLDKLVIGDKIQVKSFGCGLKLLDFPDLRICNIDPGLLSTENLTLVTGKNFTHRIYLRDGIFAEVTLLYQNGRFNPLPWTYWDYATEEVLAMLENLRNQLLLELKMAGRL